MSKDKTMKCTDCLYYEACQSWIRHGTALWDDFHYSVEDCPFYEDKSSFVELPFKAGDKIFMIVGDIEAGTAFVDEGKVISVTYEHTGVWIYARYERGVSYHHKFGCGDCFFTIAEAEKVLEDMRKEDEK